MALDRLGRANVFFGLAHPEAFATLQVNGTVTAAELNSDLVYDLSCALTESDTTYEFGDSDTDDELTFCSIGNETTATTKNATVSYTALRDASRAADTVFNLARDLMIFPDADWIAIKRIGKANTAEFAPGDRVSLVAVKNDLPTDVLGDGASVKVTNNFVPQGFVLARYKLAA